MTCCFCSAFVFGLCRQIYHKYNGDAAGVTDVVRGTVYSAGYAGVDAAIAEVIDDPQIEILRGKATVDPAHDASNTGGYRVCALCNAASNTTPTSHKANE